MKAALLAVIFSLGLASCDSALPGEPISFNRVERTNHLLVPFTGVVLLRDAASWSDFWDDYGGDPPVPSVDFSRQFVAGAFYGSDGLSGCSSRVDLFESITRFEGIVRIRLAPLPDLGSCEMLVYPIDMVVVDAPAADSYALRFEGSVPGTTD